MAETGIAETELRAWFDNTLIHRGWHPQPDLSRRRDNRRPPHPVADIVRGQFILGQEVRAAGTWYALIHDRFVLPVLAANNAWRQEQPLIQLAQAWDEADAPPPVCSPANN